MNCQNSKTTFYSKSELDLIVCTFIRYIRKGKKYHIIAPFFGHLSSVSRAIFEVLWICCHRIFLPIVAVFTLTTVLWWRSIVLRRREFFTWTKVFFQDDYLGEEQSKRDKWHKSVMYGLIKDEFAASGRQARGDNLFVNEVFPTHAIF